MGAATTTPTAHRLVARVTGAVMSDRWGTFRGPAERMKPSTPKGGVWRQLATEVQSRGRDGGAQAAWLRMRHWQLNVGRWEGGLLAADLCSRCGAPVDAAYRGPQGGSRCPCGAHALATTLERLPNRPRQERWASDESSRFAVYAGREIRAGANPTGCQIEQHFNGKWPNDNSAVSRTNAVQNTTGDPRRPS